MNQGEGPGSPGLQCEFGTIAELPQVELADGSGRAGAVSLAVDQEAAAAADAFAAVVLEARRPLSLLDQQFIELVQGF